MAAVCTEPGGAVRDHLAVPAVGGGPRCFVGMGRHYLRCVSAPSLSSRLSVGAVSMGAYVGTEQW